MKFIIDLIEDIRESIANQEAYLFTAMLLKDDASDAKKMIYAGESPLNLVNLEEKKKQLIFKIDGSTSRVTVGELIPSLLIADMDRMMYELRIDVNAIYSEVEVIGFGKNDEEKKYILFIKIV